MLCCMAVLTGTGALARWVLCRWRPFNGVPRRAAHACRRDGIAERMRRLLVLGVVLMWVGQATGALLQADTSSPAWTDFICTTAPKPLQGAPKPAWLD